MNGLVGDNFWVIHRGRSSKLVGFDACGAAAKLAVVEWCRSSGYQQMLARGPETALTVAALHYTRTD